LRSSAQEVERKSYHPHIAPCYRSNTRRRHTQQALIEFASAIHAADERLRPQVSPKALRDIVERVPGEWLVTDAPFASEREHREGYIGFLLGRVKAADDFVEEAARAHASRV